MLRLFAALVGPIFAKEMLEMARRKRYYFNRILYGAALLIVLLVVWEEHRRRLSQSHGGDKIRAMARMAEDFFLGLSCIQFGAVFLFVPLFLCGVLSGEREEHTLELLFTTRLTNTQIVLGKLCSRLVALMCLILCALPVMSLVMLFGGIDPESLWRTTAVTLLAMLFVGAHAIYFSATTKSPIGAMVRTYWWLSVWLFLAPLVVLMPLLFTLRSMHPIVQVFQLVTVLMNPLFLFAASLDESIYNRLAALGGEWFFVGAFAVPGSWSLFLIWRAICRVRLDPVPFSLPLHRIPLVRSLWGDWRHWTGNGARRRRLWADRTWFGLAVRNPLWLRARWALVYDREGYIGRVQWAAWAVVGLLLLIIATHDDLDDEEYAIGFLAAVWIGITALAALLSGASLAGDRRRGFLDLVLLTPLTGREVLNGTLLAVWEHLRRLYWLPWVLCVLFCLTGASVPVGVLLSLLTGTLFVILLVHYGIAVSLTARSVAAGLAPTFLFGVIVNLGTLALIGIFEEKHIVLLWGLTIGLMVGSWYWTRWSVSTAAVSCFLLGLHLSLCCLASCWTFDGRQDEYPVAAMHAGFLTFVAMDDRFEREFRGHAPWFLVYPCYWTALVVNMVWMRLWLTRNFDRLVGRTEADGRYPRRAPSLQSTRPPPASKYPVVEKLGRR